MAFTVEEFLFNTPLYEWVELTEENEKEVRFLFTGYKSRDFEGYNPIDNKETTFKNSNYHREGTLTSELPNEFNVCTLTCKRTGREFKFYIRAEKSKGSLRIEKIGQFPSLADFHLYKLKKYKNSILPKEKAKEFSKAIGLAAHGIGIGSFVYLRRIFEYLIFATFETQKLNQKFLKKILSNYGWMRKLKNLKAIYLSS